jgi:cell division septum initiation protein DivIVA
MEQRHIESLRAPSFSIARRGYSQREVDNFLASFADWLESDAAEELGQVAIKHKLDLVGKSTSQILLKAEEEAEGLRRRTEEESAQLLTDAEGSARKTRGTADDYAKKQRERADEEARRAIDAAGAKAKRLVEEAERRRAHIEGVIAELTTRRDETLKQLDGLQAALASTVSKHRTAGEGPRRGGQRPKTRTDGKAPV